MSVLRVAVSTCVFFCVLVNVWLLLCWFVSGWCVLFLLCSCPNKMFDDVACFRLHVLCVFACFMRA